ncbi:hypothetical protein BGZ73_001252 [Actinomortierella ambigua]|nr:hypothetical protein BGZ73_001252 [Actinomortierella ambigua]
MTDAQPAAPAPATDAPVADLVDKTEKVTITDSKDEHVHGPDCKHDHDHDHDHAEGEGAEGDKQPLGRNDYDLLEINGTREKTTDPLVKAYFEAKELYANAIELLNKIPEGAETELIEQHKDDIVKVTHDLMAAFLLDEKAVVMTQRILKLAEQYEKYVQAYNPEGTSTATVDSEEEGAEQQTTIYTKDSVIFVIWILFSGQQWSHCIQTLGFAITEFEDIRPRMLELRASCHMALRNYKNCTEDLEQVLEISPSSIETHSMLGNVYYATHDAAASLSHFKAFVAEAHVDSRTLPNAYYALSTLTLQSAPSGATKKKSNQALKQAAVFKEAQEYYTKALEADQRFKELYGVVTAFNDIKRTAVLAFQARNPATSGRTLLPNLQQTNALEDAANALRKTFKTPGLASCAYCGRPDNVANEGRSEELKPKPLIKCTKCSKVAYCSRPCQIKHWNAGHKDTCKK